MKTFLILNFCFHTVLFVGAADVIRVSNAVTFLQSETAEFGPYKPVLNDYGLVNLETRTRLRRQTKVGTPLSANDIEEILNTHNAYRRLEPASDMQYMTWNSYLADMATEWSSMCIWGHGQPERKPATMPFNPLGQNLYLSMGPSINISFLVWRWYSEKMYYNYTTDTCETDEMCSHFTQVVWSLSREVGCGKYLCPKAVDKKTQEIYKNAWIFACNYGPAGNYKAIRPYALGKPCTACISGQMWCDREEPRGLCRRDCNQTSDACECKASCKNGGVVSQSNQSCSCQCTNDWGDGDCGKICCDYHSFCGNSWPKSYCYDRNHGDLIRSYCFKTCGLCTDATQTEQGSCPVFTTTTAYSDNRTYFNSTFEPFSSSPASSTFTLSTTISTTVSIPTTTSTTTPTSTTTMTTSVTKSIPTNPTTTSIASSTTSPIPTVPTVTSTTTPIPTNLATTSTITPIPTNPATTSTTMPTPTNPATASTAPSIPTNPITTSATTPIPTNPETTSTTTPIPTNLATTSATTPIPTNSITTSATTPNPIIPVTTYPTTSSTTPISTNPVTTSTTTLIPIIPVTASTTKPISTNLVITSTTPSTTPISTNPVTTSTTTLIPIIPVTVSTTTSSTTPIPTIPSTTTSISISSTTTSTTNSSPVSPLHPTTSLSSHPIDATSSDGEFTKSVSNQMLWMIVIVSTLGAVIVLVIVIVIILLLLCRSRFKKQSQTFAESSRPHEINRYNATTNNASAPPPANPFFRQEVIALDNIQDYFIEDTAKAYPPIPTGSSQANVNTYK